MLQVLHNCVLVLIHGLEAHLVSQEDPEEEEEDLNLLPDEACPPAADEEAARFSENSE